MYMSRLEVEGESGSICLNYYSSSLRSYAMGSPKLGNLPIWCHHMGHPACHSEGLVHPAGSAIPLHVYPPGSGGQLFLPYSGSLLMVFPSFSETRIFWEPLECTGNHWNCWEQRCPVSFPHHRCQGEFIINSLPPHRNSCQETRLERGPNSSSKTIHRLAAPSVHYYKLSLWNIAVSKNTPFGCFYLFFILRSMADICHIIIFWLYSTFFKRT